MATPSTEESPDVRREDQDYINEFGRLSMKKSELKDDIADIIKRIDDLGDAEEEIMMVDDSIPGATKLMIGETFIDVDSTTATDFVNEALTAAKANKTKFEAEFASIEARQKELKKILYARFGKSINLEE